MNSVARAAFEAHLAACGVCAAELDELRRLSRHLAAGVIPKLSSEAIARLHGSVNAVEERGVLRLAGWLTAAAAAVLVIGIGGFFMRQETMHAKAPDTWEQAAVAYPAEAEPADRAGIVQMAQWIHTDLSGAAR